MFFTPHSERYKNCSLEEVIYLQEVEKQMNSQSKQEQLQLDIDYIAEVEHIVEKAKKKERRKF
ncbi:hypothetical protein KHA80_09270 [Anaerobacillus sp. HL2]|nr:hypothetical protein KHA80_09270 [Anaerobacillus sp. HL2]